MLRDAAASGARCACSSETDSTNDDARARRARGRAATAHVVIADGQRAGRGSHGRAWTSPARQRPLSVDRGAAARWRSRALPPLTLAVGLGVADAVEALLPGRHARTEVKWPNDVWLLGKKCAGILVEASTRRQRPRTGRDRHRAEREPPGVGRGTARRPRPRCARRAVSRSTAARRCARCCFAVERWVDRFVAEGGQAIAAALDARLAMRGQRVRCAEHEGTLLGVAPSGAIRIATAHGTRELIAGRLEPWTA